MLTGYSVATGASVGCETSGVSAGGGVVSSANTLMGKTSDDISDNKTMIEKTVNFFACFIDMSPTLLITAIGLIRAISSFHNASVMKRDFK